MRSRRLYTAILLVAAAVLATNLIVLTGGRTEGPQKRAGRVWGETPDVEIALVLGAAVRDGRPSDVLRDRLDESLALYRAGRVRKILVSGDHRTAVYDEPNAMRRYLEAKGVPPADIFMDHAGLDTYSSVWRAKHVFGARKLIVVTQQFHLSRAVWCSRALGMEAEGAASDRHLYRGIAWLHAREVVSRTKAFVDVTRRRVPRHGGAPIDLGGDGRVTAG
ncbi:MAG: YdcF family protein [Labilithrix sp.]|nr:YdcF family protein [Labilithrix sp.]MCW5813193.1 YdcF family protein [Labilithrix sp.]